MTLAGVAAVARQEFTVRIRKGRWRWLLGAWFLVLLALTALLRESVLRAGRGVQPFRGAVMYGGLMLIVLSMALLVAPALTAQSVNGDRERGTLATLQVTRLSPLEIMLGKFGAAWGTMLVFLALTAPLVLWCVANGGVDAMSVVVVSVVMAVLLGTVCAVSLGLSSVLSRTTTSGVLSYLVVFALTIGTLVVFGLSSIATQETVTRPCAVEPPPPSAVEGQPAQVPDDCSFTTTRVRTDRTWLILAANPFVVLADAAPHRERCDDRTPQPASGAVRGPDVEPVEYCDNGLDPLGGIGRTVRDLRKPHVPEQPMTSSYLPPPARGKAVWPTGLTVNLVLGLGMLAVTVRQLRTPYRELPRGQRVA
ncbi:MAG TPA: ABC transporter permease [Mycobacteriales bacterium]|nr:ABC transporter permease [Mycobacteriales bacterium]